MKDFNVYERIKYMTRQKHITEELFRVFNSYIALIYAASTPPVNINTAMELLYNGDYDEAKKNHKINQISFEIIMQHFDTDFYTLVEKNYKRNKYSTPVEELHSYIKSQILSGSPEFK